MGVSGGGYLRMARRSHFRPVATCGDRGDLLPNVAHCRHHDFCISLQTPGVEAYTSCNGKEEAKLVYGSLVDALPRRRTVSLGCMHACMERRQSDSC
jgi:hypothetical protein